jgi:hypothetical protein
MIAWDKHIRVWQLLGAVLAVPAGIAGTYGAYRSYVSNDVSCPELRASIIATLERNIPLETKRTLLHKSITEFDEHCGQTDPDARAIFDAAIATPPPLPSPGPREATGAPPAPIFGLSKSGERRGWIAMLRHDDNHNEVPNFDAGGFPVGSTAPPSVGTIVTARRMLPVWLEPRTPNDPSLLQGRLAEGACVKILSIRPATPRLWAEVAPETCK